MSAPRGRLPYYWQRLRRRYAQLEEDRRLRARFPTLHLAPGVEVVNPEGLHVGKRVVVQRGAILHCGGLEWSEGRGHIHIGDDSVISHYCVLFGAGGIDIGRRFDCGPGCMVFSSRSASGGDGHVFAPVVIGNDVILYAGCVVSPGVTIGDGAAIGAGSVVLDDVPPRTLFVGSPAAYVRDVGASVDP